MYWWLEGDLQDVSQDGNVCISCGFFRRGDFNDDGVANIGDAVAIVDYSYGLHPESSCLDAADANDDGWVNMWDAVYILTWLLEGGPEPPRHSGW